MTATQPTAMAPTSDLRPDPTPAATAAEPQAAASEARLSRWARFGDHPFQTAIATAAVGLLFFSLTTLDNDIEKVDAKVDALDTKVDEINLNLTTQINELDRKLTAQINELDLKFTAQINELDLKFTTLINELDLKLTTLINELDLKLTTLINELDLKLTALIAGLGMTDLVDAATEGRLPAAEPADSEPAGAPG